MIAEAQGPRKKQRGCRASPGTLKCRQPAEGGALQDAAGVTVTVTDVAGFVLSHSADVNNPRGCQGRSDWGEAEAEGDGPPWRGAQPSWGTASVHLCSLKVPIHGGAGRVLGQRA